MSAALLAAAITKIASTATTRMGKNTVGDCMTSVNFTSATTIATTGRISRKLMIPMEKPPTSDSPQVFLIVSTERLNALAGPTPSTTITGTTKNVRAVQA